MTPEQHNKYLGFAHLAYAALHSLMGILFGVIMGAMFSVIPAQRGGPPPPPPLFFVVMGFFLLVFTLGWAVPSMIAAYALLKRKRWAKTAAIVAAVFAAVRMPVGTAVSVYTFWFLFSEPGRSLYDRPAKALPTGEWSGIDYQKRTENEYAPTASPPDWR